ncbi:MAG: flagellar hook-associated protein FlgK [Planctomycetota bacterium]|jgi:flagellar hook-associated protein 1 FlgK
MYDFSIGISGLKAAQNAMDVIGNNMANAATDGFHRQRIDLSPAYSSQYGETLLGGGVEVKSITRMIDTLLEQEILRQDSSLEQLNQEYNTLRTIENAMGEFSAGGGLGEVIDDFFAALDELSAHTDEIIWQKQAVSAAETMAGQFRTLGEYLSNLEDQLELEVENAVEEINTLTTQIAQLNNHIETSEIASDSQANNLRDQRDQLVTQLSKLIDVETQNQAHGVVNIMVSGIPVVVGASSTDLTSSTTVNNKYGVAVSGTYNYDTSIEGGKIGGLLSLRNTILSDIQDNLDTLANTMVQQINQALSPLYPDGH